MYNLLVSGHLEAWEGEPFTLELGRCVREYTDGDLTERFGDLGNGAKKDLRKLPSIFAYEGERKDPKFGFITDLKRRGGQVLIEYEIVEVPKFLTAEYLADAPAKLDIVKWEMNRTHWAVKDVNLYAVLSEQGIELPNWVRSVSKAVDVSTHTFDVALSFPGEVRELVEKVAEKLERLVGPNAYFYDENFVAQLARPGLDVLLQDIYGKRSKLIVVFVGANYQAKDWCGIEFRAIRDILAKRENDRIMFIRTDDGEVEGVFKTDGYVDARKHGPDKIAEFIADRVGYLK